MGKSLFYLLSFTWGILTTLVGAVVTLVVCILGGNSNGRYGYCWVFEFGKGWGGMSVGPFMIISKDSYTSVLKHEHGHAIQNCWFGPFMPFIVSIPSAIRYWYRKLRYTRKGINPPTLYDAIWFEGQATKVGTEFIRKYFRG